MMTTRRLLVGLTATALAASSCGTGAQDTATTAETVLVLQAPAPSGNTSERGGLSSQAAPGTSQAPSTPAEAPSTPAEAATPDKPATQPAGAQTRLGSTVLAATLDPDAQTSARFEASIEMTSAEYPEPFVVTIRGAFDVPNEASELELDFSGIESMLAAETDGSDQVEGFADFGAMFSDPMRMITIGDEAWMQWGFLGFLGVEDDEWLAMDAESDEMFGPGDLGFGGLGSPTDLLDSMQELDASIEELGTETIHGVETRHLRATIDPSALSASDQADFEADFGQLPTEALPVDFWIGDDGLLYRFSMSFTGADLEQADDFDSFTMTFDMFDYGVDLGIAPPDPSTVVDEESLGLN